MADDKVKVLRQEMAERVWAGMQKGHTTDAVMQDLFDMVTWFHRVRIAEAEWNTRHQPNGGAGAKDARDAERWRWGAANARWIRHEHEAYIAIPVAVDANLSCTAMMVHAIDAAMSAQNKGKV